MTCPLVKAERSHNVGLDGNRKLVLAAFFMKKMFKISVVLCRKKNMLMIIFMRYVIVCYYPVNIHRNALTFY